MGCIVQPASCLQFTIMIQELSSNLLVSYSFTYQVLISLFFQPRNHFSTEVNKLIQSVRAVLESFTRSSSDVNQNCVDRVLYD